MLGLSARAGSQYVGRPNRLPKGGTAPGCNPVSWASSSLLAKRSDFTWSASRAFLLSSLRSAGKIRTTNWSSAFITKAFAPLESGVPRTAAACSLVETGSCRSTSNSTCCCRSQSHSRSNTVVPTKALGRNYSSSGADSLLDVGNAAGILSQDFPALI